MTDASAKTLWRRRRVWIALVAVVLLIAATAIIVLNLAGGNPVEGPPGNDGNISRDLTTRSQPEGPVDDGR